MAASLKSDLSESGPQNFRSRKKHLVFYKYRSCLWQAIASHALLLKILQIYGEGLNSDLHLEGGKAASPF